MLNWSQQPRTLNDCFVLVQHVIDQMCGVEFNQLYVIDIVPLHTCPYMTL